jgi:hypothetical protein
MGVVELRTFLRRQASKFAFLNPVLVYRFRDSAGVLGSKLRAIFSAMLPVTGGTSNFAAYGVGGKVGHSGFPAPVIVSNVNLVWTTGCDRPDSIKLMCRCDTSLAIDKCS